MLKTPTAHIDFQDVEFSYDSAKILKKLNFSVFHGELVALLGQSGCGKTTLLKTVNTLLPTQAGAVLIDQKPVQDWDPITLRRNIGYVIQNAGLFPHWTIEKNLSLTPTLNGWSKEKISARVQELMELIQLPFQDFRHRHPHELSGGQRQRVGVARAMAAKPSILLMDEPFGALDPLTRIDLQDELLQIQKEQGLTILFVTHSIQEALKLSNRIALLDKGQIVFLGTPEEFLNTESVHTAPYHKVLKYPVRKESSV